MPRRNKYDPSEPDFSQEEIAGFAIAAFTGGLIILGGIFVLLSKLFAKIGDRMSIFFGKINSKHLWQEFIFSIALSALITVATDYFGKNEEISSWTCLITIIVFCVFWHIFPNKIET